MTRPVYWTTAALDDLKDQIDHIAADSPDAAEKVGTRLWTTAAMLGEMATGRPGRVGGTYEKSVSRLPCIIAYAIGTESRGEYVSILRIVHTARHWPPAGWPE